MTVRFWFCAITAIYFRSYKWPQLILELFKHWVVLSLSHLNRTDHFTNVDGDRTIISWVYLYDIEQCFSTFFASNPGSRKNFELLSRSNFFAMIMSQKIERCWEIILAKPISQQPFWTKMLFPPKGLGWYRFC